MNNEDDQIQLGDTDWIFVAEGLKNVVTGEIITEQELDETDTQED